MGWIATLLMIAGLSLPASCAHQGTGTRALDAAGRVPVRVFLHGVGTPLIYGRYLLPMLPFVCLLASIAVVSGVSLLRRFDIHARRGGC